MKNLISQVLKEFLKVFMVFFLMLAAIVGLVKLYLHKDYDSSKNISSSSILMIDLNKKIEESKQSTFSKGINIPGFSSGSSLSLNDVLNSIHRAEQDSRIIGIVLNIESPECGWATLQEIRQALQEFKKKSKKRIFTYGNFYDEKAYYVASVSDKIFLNPNGEVKWQGLSTHVILYKDLLDRVGIEPVIYKVGKFKSAVEPVSRNEMSDSSRLQTKVLLEVINKKITNSIAESRKIDSKLLNFYADNLSFRTSADALKYGFVTDIGYYEDFLSFIEKQNEVNNKSQLQDISNYIEEDSNTEKVSAKNKVAVLIIQGDIVMGEGGNNIIGSESTINALNKLKDDDNVKSVVLRINSPGGSAFASNLIWHAVEQLKKKKPVIASFSEYAASGGYYIGMGCSQIVANELSVTGSIGIFGYILNSKQLFEKAGIHSEIISTNKYADFPSTNRNISEFEKNILQEHADSGYQLFTGLVSQSRKMPMKEVQTVAGGRVWSGLDAKRIKLIDKIGGLRDATLLAAEKGGLKNGDYHVEYCYQEQSIENSINRLFEFQGMTMPKNLQIVDKLFKTAKFINNSHDLQARIPYEYDIR